jgi:hypothetical protein
MNIYLDSVIIEEQKKDILKDLEILDIKGASSISISKVNIDKKNSTGIYQGIDYIINIMDNKKNLTTFNFEDSEHLSIDTYEGKLRTISFRNNNSYLINLFD